VYGEIIYSGDDRGEVDAVSAARLQVWDTDHGVFLTKGAITADLRVDDSGLYVACTDTKLYCINRTTGKLKWQYFAGGQLSSSPVLTADTVYQMTPNLGLVALDKAAVPEKNAQATPTTAYDRVPKWTCREAEQFLSQDARYTYVAEGRANPMGPELPRQQWVVALDRQTGKPAYESEHHDFAIFGTNPRDGLIYVGFADGKLMALAPVLRAGQIGEMVMVPVSPPVTVAMAGR
jgi:outer membrane protein assembly factor BamB